MRMSVLIATSMVLLSFAYRWFARGVSLTPKNVFSWGFILVTLSILGNTELGETVDLFSYLIITIIVLNDGYDFVSNI